MRPEGVRKNERSDATREMSPGAFVKKQQAAQSRLHANMAKNIHHQKSRRTQQNE